MKSLPATFRLKRVDREIITMARAGISEKEIARKTGLTYRSVKRKIGKLRRLELL